jgi:hypothetical protein
MENEQALSLQEARINGTVKELSKEEEAKLKAFGDMDEIYDFELV